MPLSRFVMENITVFEKAVFDFVPGINVLVGENATGKTHVLKCIYALHRGMMYPEAVTKSRMEISAEHFRLVFGVDGETGSDGLNFLRRKTRKGPSGVPRMLHSWGDDQHLFTVTGGGASAARRRKPEVHAPVPLFLPTREVLSILPGLSALVRRRLLAFDVTYADLADALEVPALKGKALEKVEPLLTKIERAAGGREVKKGNRFLVKQQGVAFESHMVAEGHRKLATLARLVRNGTIMPGVIVLWDEPEANLNPVLLRSLIAILLELARAGVQLVLASHDYLLTQTLSLHAEHRSADTPPMRFFSLSRQGKGPVAVRQADTIAELADNPILREHARQYDLELEAFEGGGAPGNRP